MMYALAFVVAAFGIGIDTHATLSCIDETVNLSFENATLTTNNLGGFGPDTGADPVMLFENVGNYEGKTLDLVVSVKEGSAYLPNDEDNNGLNGKFGVINLDVNQETTFVFVFNEHGTDMPIVLDGFKVSIYDIDQGGKVSESYVIKGWETALYDDNTDEAIFSETDYDCATVSGHCLYAKSNQLGKGCDNPTDPMTLSTNFTCKNNSVNQLARSFQVDYLEKSSFELLFRAQLRPDKEGGGGRNALFGFESAWDEYCEDRSTPDPRLCTE